MKKLYFIASAALLQLAACTKHNENNNVNAVDHDFMTQTSKAYKTEIETGQLAVAKTNDPALKAFAQTMVTSYRAADEELRKMADYLHVELLDASAAERQSSIDRLSTFSGFAFDTSYAADQVKSHQKLLSIYQDAFNNGNNATVKGYVHRYVESIQKNYHTADSLARSL